MIPIDTPRGPALDRAAAMRLAATEYQRVLDLLRALEPNDWTKPTDWAAPRFPDSHYSCC